MLQHIGRPASERKLRRQASPLLVVCLCAAPVVIPAPSAPAPEGGESAVWRPLEHAPQTIYADGVPHTDAAGRTRTVYDPEQSFLPLGLYHGLNFLDSDDPDDGELPSPMSAIRAAGFTFVHTNRALGAAYLDRLHRHGLRIVKSEARPGDAEAFGDHPAVLAWDVFDEPDSDGKFDVYPARFEAFEAFRAGIRKHDPVRAIFVNTVAWIHAGHANRPWWIKWHRAGDLSCHDNYPIVHAHTPTSSLIDSEWGQGIPETVSLAVEAVAEGKPVWLILQAYGQPEGQRWRYPSPAEARCMAYASLVHGATGFCWFSFDVDTVRRHAGGWGISPAPLPCYNSDNEGFVADDATLESIRTLWATVAALNREFTRIREWLFAPTPSLPYQVAVRGEAVSETPVRTLLKQYGDEWLLIAVNVDAVALDLRLNLPAPLRDLRVESKFGRNAPASYADGVMNDSIGPLGVAVYGFSPSAQSSGD